jgi:hypothetical protein
MQSNGTLVKMDKAKKLAKQADKASKPRFEGKTWKRTDKRQQWV